MAKPPPLPTREIAAVFHALAQDTRLEAYRLLVRYHPYGLAAGDISRLLSVPHNTLSTHLQELEAAGLVVSRREGRSVIFAAKPARLVEIAASLAAPGTPRPAPPRTAPQPPAFPLKRPGAVASPGPYKVLVLCSGNSARSLIAEAIIRREGAGRFEAFSAGSAPRKRANPAALRLLRRLGYDTTSLRPKCWTEFARPDAPQMDFIITLCDRAAGEACPDWPGHPRLVHWGVPAASELAPSREAIDEALKLTYRRLMHRVTALVNLPIEQLSEADLEARLEAIAGFEGATDLALAGRDDGGL